MINQWACVTCLLFWENIIAGSKAVMIAVHIITHTQVCTYTRSCSVTNGVVLDESAAGSETGASVVTLKWIIP